MKTLKTKTREKSTKQKRKTKLVLLSAEGMSPDELHGLRNYLAGYTAEKDYAFLILGKPLEVIDKSDLLYVIGDFIKGAIGDKAKDIALESKLKKRLGEKLDEGHKK